MYRLSYFFSVVSLLILVSVAKTVSAQENVGEESTVRYPASYFSEWAPVTAQDMLDRIPGLDPRSMGSSFSGGSSSGGPSIVGGGRLPPGVGGGRGGGAAARGGRRCQRRGRRARAHRGRVVAVACLQHPGRAGGALRGRRCGGSRPAQTGARRTTPRQRYRVTRILISPR